MNTLKILQEAFLNEVSYMISHVGQHNTKLYGLKMGCHSICLCERQIVNSFETKVMSLSSFPHKRITFVLNASQNCQASTQ